MGNTLGRVGFSHPNPQVHKDPTLNMFIRMKYPKALSQIQAHQENLFRKSFLDLHQLCCTTPRASPMGVEPPAVVQHCGLDL